MRMPRTLRLLLLIVLLRMAMPATADCIGFTYLPTTYNSQPVDCSSNDLWIADTGSLVVGASVPASFDAGLRFTMPITTTTNWGQIRVYDGSRFTNNMVLSNNRSILNTGLLDNQMQFTNEVGGVISSDSPAAGAGLRNALNFTNSGRIDIVSGEFVNSGALTVTGSGVVNQAGQGRNDGSLTLDGGRFVNSGSFENWSEFDILVGGGLRNTGRFVNQPGASVWSLGTVTLDAPTSNHGEWSNHGTLQVNAAMTGSGNYYNQGMLVLGGPDGSLGVAGTLANSGQMLVSAGSRLSLLQGSALMLSGGVLRVEGDLELDAPFTLSPSHQAHLLDLAGGTVMNRSAFVVSAGSFLDGRSNIDNQGRFTVGGRLALLLNGAEQHGHFLNQKGGVMQVAPGGTLIVGTSVQNLGTLQTDGELRLDGGYVNNLGAWVNSGTVDLRDASAITPMQGTGTYLQTDGLFQLNGDAYQASFTFRGGRVCGDATFHGAVDLSGATLCPGHSPGTMRFADGLTMSAGTLEMEIAGASDGQFDRLLVGGDVLITGGAMHLVFLGGFVPQAGEHFALLTASGVLSGWEQLAQQVDGLPAGLQGRFSLGSGGLEFVVQTTSAVPEPSTGAALLAGLAVTGWVARRRRPRGLLAA